MSMVDQVRPGTDSWVASIHLSEDDLTPLGGGVLIDARRVLTCAHLVMNRDNLWVAFPRAEKAAGVVRRRAERIVVPAGRYAVQDLALLVLAEPVPPGVTAARLRCPSPSVLAGLRWWAYGFPGEDHLGNSADGIIGAALAYGWIRLDALSRYQVERGFSGGGLWSPDYQAVIAVVGQANDRGDGRAITLHQADASFPGEQLQTSWVWALSGDPEAARHWRPRARGVSIDSEQGYRFRGRTATLQAITGWLDRRQIDRRVLMVTGSPGAGKSAVLGRIVTTADPREVSELPSSDTAVRASPGSVACAVHAKGKTALEVATEIARAASAALPDQLEDLAPAVRAVLAGRKDRRFNVIIDSLDEAAGPEAGAEAGSEQIQTIISKVILPIAETCGDVGLQVVVGSRRSVAGREVLAAFGSPAEVIDLDDARFFAEDDLAAYALATLKLAGGERPGNPYAGDDIARPIAGRIAELSNRNFLVAGLIARARGLYDHQAVDPAQLSFTPGVDMAMQEYLGRLAPSAGVAADAVLTALAFAEADGMPVDLWREALPALGARIVPAAELVKFARSPAASFLVESSSSGPGGTVFRLFHQALNDALLRARAEDASYRDDERALTRAFLAAGRDAGWPHAPVYLLRHLPSHAARAGMIDDLLTDDGYLLHADLSRLMPLVQGATSYAGQRRARLLRLTPRAFTADPPVRAAMFSITETLEGLGNDFTRGDGPAPYRALWAAAVPSNEQAVLDGHTAQVQCVCPFTLDGRVLLASTSYDQTVRVWDPAVGTGQLILRGHEGAVNAVCAFTLDGRTLLASGGGDRTVRIWDPAAGTQQSVLRGHAGWITSICAFSLDGRPLLATGSYDQTVRVWDPATGVQRLAMTGHTDRIESVGAFSLDGRTLLASGGKDQAVRIWDPVDGTRHPAMYRHTSAVRSVSALGRDGHPVLVIGGNEQGIRTWDPATGAQRSGTCGDTGWVRSVSSFTLDGRSLLATASDDHTVRIWDPAAGPRRASPAGHTSDIRSVSPFTLDGRVLLAGAEGSGQTRIWDVATGTQLPVRHDHPGPVTAVCAFALDQDMLLATVSSDDPSICLWNPATGAQHSTLRGHTHEITSLCAFTDGGRARLLTASYDHTARIWDPATGIQCAALDCADLITAVCAITRDGRTLLATGNDHTVRIWDPATGNPGSAHSILRGHTDRITSLSPFTADNDILLASSGNDRTIRIWDLASGTQRAVLEGHKDRILALCTVAAGGRTLLATGGNDRAIRIWDPLTETTIEEIPVHQPVQAISYASGLLLAGTAAGLLAIRLDLDPSCR